MARAVKATRASKPAPKASPAKSAPVAKRPSAAAPSLPKLGKEELRAQVEKLERANATLRAKNRQAGQTAKAATARVAELEAQVEQLEQAAVSQKSRSEKALAKATAKAGEAVKPAARKPARTSARAARSKPEIDPGDAVPPGVAVAEPQPLDEEAEEAKENLEQHLHDDQDTTSLVDEA